MLDRKDIIRKIRALQEKTVANGCTESEALSAAKLVAKLLSDYDLSLTNIEIGEERCEIEYLETGRKAAHEVSYCVIAIAQYTNTQVWSDSRNGQKSFAFFGFPTDTAAAIYLMTVIKTAMDCELVSYKARCRELGEPTGRRQSHAFLLGMAVRVRERLREMHAAQRQDTKSTTGRDLVVVKDSAVKAQFARLGLCLKSTKRTTSIGDSGSFNAGKAAGNRVGLNRGLGQNNAGYMIGNK